MKHDLATVKRFVPATVAGEIGNAERQRGCRRGPDSGAQFLLGLGRSNRRDNLMALVEQLGDAPPGDEAAAARYRHTRHATLLRNSHAAVAGS